ncbi:MAG: carboxypeptidase-like regulatory domain-containing protein [Vicinamibacterales bacterium]
MTRTTLAFAIVAAVTAAPVGHAAQRRGGPPPPRERTGTAVIAGRVVTTATSATPVARALVTITSDALARGRTVITGLDGAFAFGGLPAGNYTLVAARPPYVAATYGARRPGQPGTPITLADGQRFADVTLALARGAAISGIVREGDGEPAAGVRLEVVPLGTATPDPGIPIETDDRGMYRAFGLLPGRYVVRATIPNAAARELALRSDDEIDAILTRLRSRGAGRGRGIAGGSRGPAAGPSRPAPPAAVYGYAPVYYPGTVDPDQAAVVLIAEGEDRGGVDIALQAVRVGAVAGRVTWSGGEVPGTTSLTLVREMTGPAARDPVLAERLVPPAGARPGPDGTFRFGSVLPGRYRLTARTVSQQDGVLWALADLTVGAEEAEVTLALQPGLRLTGRAVFEGDVPVQPDDVTRFRLRLVEMTGAPVVAPSAPVGDDGRFVFTGISPGTYAPASMFAPPGWWLRSAFVSGRDLLDYPLDIGPAGDVNGMVATFTNRHSELSGTLLGAGARPAPDYFIVVLPAERAMWRPGARRIQAVRPGTDGHFAFANLPGGDYLIAALADMEVSDLVDPAFLEQLVPAAVPVHLDEGARVAQDLRIAGR